MERLRPSQWVQDLAVAVLVAGLGLLEVWGPMESAMGEGSPLVSTVGIVAFAALLSQRRARPTVAFAAMGVWPVLGILVQGDLQILFFGQLVPLTVLVYSLARHGPGRIKWLSALAAAAMILFADFFIGVLQDPGELVFHWGVVTLAYLTGRGLRSAEDRAVASTRRAVEAETTTREQARVAVAEERARIARELHDIVAHSVSMIVVQAGAAEQVVEEDPDFTRKALGTIRTTGVGALTEMRRVVAMLRAPEPVDLTPQPGVGTLPLLVATVREAGLDVDLRVSGESRALAGGLDLTVYRIVQEALTNVRRHSDSEWARVALDFTADALEILVCDGGPARDGHTNAGHGLIGMRERAALFGGRLETSADGGGFTVRAVLPLEAP